MSHFPCYPSCPLKEKCFLLNHHFFLLPSSRCFIVRVGEPISSGWPRKRRRLCRTGEDCHGSDCGTYWRTIFWTCRHDTSDTGKAKRNFSQDKSRDSSRPHCLLPIFVDPWASGLGSSWASRFHWTRVHEFIARYLTELDELPINEIFVRGFGQTLPLFFLGRCLYFCPAQSVVVTMLLWNCVTSRKQRQSYPTGPKSKPLTGYLVDFPLQDVANVYVE